MMPSNSSQPFSMALGVVAEAPATNDLQHAYEFAVLTECDTTGWNALAEGSVDGGYLEWARSRSEADLPTDARLIDRVPVKHKYSLPAFRSLTQGSPPVGTYEDAVLETYITDDWTQVRPLRYATYEGYVSEEELEDGDPEKWSGTRAEHGPHGKKPLYLLREKGGNRILFPILSYETGRFISKVLSPLRITTWVAGGAIELRPYFFYRQENDYDEWYVTPVDASNGGSLPGSTSYKLSTGMEPVRFPAGSRIPTQPTEIEVHKGRLRMRVAISPSNRALVPISVLSFGHMGTYGELVRSEVYDSYLNINRESSMRSEITLLSRALEGMLDLSSLSYVVMLIVSASLQSYRTIAFWAATLETIVELGVRFFAAVIRPTWKERWRSFFMPYAELVWGSARPSFGPRCARAPFIFEAWGGFFVWAMTVVDVAYEGDSFGFILVTVGGAVFALSGWNSQVIKDLFGCRIEDQGSVFIAYASMYATGLFGQVRFLTKIHRSSILAIVITSSLSAIDTLCAGASAAAAAWSFLDDNNRVLDEKVLYASRTGVYAMLPEYVWVGTRRLLILVGDDTKQLSSAPVRDFAGVLYGTELVVNEIDVAGMPLLVVHSEHGIFEGDEARPAGPCQALYEGACSKKETRGSIVTLQCIPGTGVPVL